jgi:serine/threonine-protein phosphatase 2A activator
MSVSRIREVKRGPFHEHSSQLYSIAVGVPNWGKVNSGLFKMYDVSNFVSCPHLSVTVCDHFFSAPKAEVLGKRVVVQHIPLGGLLEWDAPSNSDTEHSQN